MTKTHYQENKLRRGSTFKYLFGLLVAATLEVHATQSRDQDPWWFEVEAIVFERAINPDTIEEQFPLEASYIASKDLPDFITKALLPDFDFLRQGAKTCLSEEKPLPLPAQTAKYPRILDVSNMHDLAKKLENDDTGISESLLASSLMSQPEWIVQNKPSETWQQGLDTFFTDLSTEYSDWKSQSEAPVFYRIQAVTHKQSPQSVDLPKTLYCQWSSEQALFSDPEINKLRNYAFLPEIPSVIDGIELPYSDIAYALPAQQLQLKKLRRDINRTRGLTVLLHTAWRQNVIIGRDNAPWYRLVAGKNYSKEFNYAGLPLDGPASNNKTETKTLFEQIKTILDTDVSENEKTSLIPEQLLALRASPLNSVSNEVWELDGRIKIFIEYLGRTPYLHLDSDLNFRAPVYIDWQGQEANDSAQTITDSSGISNAIAPAPNFLKTFHFDQLRRMISTELHYFDHPLFGMVVQIRRYQRPEPPETDLSE
ncbi:CsiV family protein [Planctobacterium marinum]|uniref:Uncharacterized protein n=1 Tax=Planctobacterium marinum TaxID=1631968 RepID=A0AA48KSP3_9ALTE|nr:hypothetical protein MACH26_22150 [Planctobacterium marinum]